MSCVIFRCPVLLFRCPLLLFRCPVLLFRCLGLGFRCPVLLLRCPVLFFRCPVFLLRCLVLPFRCPVLLLRCPVLLLRCPELLLRLSLGGRGWGEIDGRVETLKILPGTRFCIKLWNGLYYICKLIILTHIWVVLSIRVAEIKNLKDSTSELYNSASGIISVLMNLLTYRENF